MEEVMIRWKKERRRFFISIILFSFFFFMSLPIGIGLFPVAFTSSPFWGLSWVWIYAFLQVIATWVISYLYWKKAKYFDEMVASYRRGEKE